ncbi:hypothetical protein RYH70_07040 [Alloalcanivorax xenomutans]|uniref:P-loop ATPase, Sll1717 family n=1 Tax=Alloalcanivorax xenomutans TaxID=1094342 RepID=UPI0029348511|nr:hypothetical protein [Alloalcanivorax xenomutans]WOD29823.1 hypothetical protein RYH70_07040 [Alloalcanivorax xenomutans]
MVRKKTSLAIKKNMKIGDLEAETDRDLLGACFIDKGDLSQLLNVKAPEAIILGRTGSGKSALILKGIAAVNNSVFLDPSDISIRFLEHSDIIQFFDALGVKLDLFYQVLWRHVLVVELLRMRYGLKSEHDNKSFLEKFYRLMAKDKLKKKALEYFTEWGDRFWIDTDEHLREITRKLERDVRTEIGAGWGTIALTGSGALNLSESDKVEVSQRASRVVSGLQIKKLNEVLDLLSEYAFEDRQKRYYVFIDKLDVDWAETDIRCKFIRALIEEVKTFRRLENVKIIAALRHDLLDMVFDRTRGSGFQEEKYESYLLPVVWKRDELGRVIDKRINEIFVRQYTKQGVGFDDIFPPPKKGGGPKSIDYILDRTLLRPRDALQFVNEIFKVASGSEKISWRDIFAAESIYSKKRLNSLKEEWGDIYPELLETIEILRGLDYTFTRGQMTDDRINDVCISLFEGNSRDPCVRVVKKYFGDSGGKIKSSDIVTTMLMSLYHVGAIGVKISSLDTFIWSYIDQPTISRSEIRRSNHIKIHKMLWRSLNVVF